MSKVKKGFASLAALLPEDTVQTFVKVQVEKVSEPSLKDRQALAIAKAKELYSVPDTATIRVYGDNFLEVSICIEELIAPIPKTFAEWETTQWVEQTRYITVKFMSNGDIREHWESVLKNKEFRPLLKERQLPIFFPEFFWEEDGKVFAMFRGLKCLVSEPSTPRILARHNREEFLGFGSVPTIQVYLSSDIIEYGKRKVCRYCDIDLIGYYSTEIESSSNGCATSRDSDGMWNK